MQHEQLKKDITVFRTEIDTCINSIPAYIKSSRQVSLANTALERSFSWLGECLKVTGCPTPYAESENPSSTKIEPTADHVEGAVIEEMKTVGASEVARVKLFRSVLGIIIAKLKAFKEATVIDDTDFNISIKEAYVSLKDAKIWFGWELGRLGKLPQ